MRRHVYSNGGLVLYARERKRYPAASFCPATTSREKEVTRTAQRVRWSRPPAGSLFPPPSPLALLASGKRFVFFLPPTAATENGLFEARRPIWKSRLTASLFARRVGKFTDELY